MTSRSPLAPIFLTVFVDVLGLTLVLPLLPHYALHFQATPLVVGLLTASYAACGLVSGPILGRMSDRVGRKPVLLISQVGTFIGFLILGGANALWMLFLSRIIDGVTAGNLTIAQAYISDVTKPEDRTKSFAFIGISFGMGFLLGPAISGVLAHRFGYGAPAWAAAGLSFLSIVATALFLPNKAELRAIKDELGAPPSVVAGRSLSFGSFFRRRLPRQRLLQFFAFTTSFSILIGGLALYLKQRFSFDVEKTGYVFALSGLVGAIVQGGLIGRLVKRLGEVKLSLIGFIAQALGIAAVGLVYKPMMMVPFISVGSFGTAVLRPCLTTLITKSVGPEEQGGALGVSQSLGGVSQIVGPIIAGFLIEHNRLDMWGYASALVGAIGAVLILTGDPGEEAPAAGSAGHQPQSE